LLPARDMVRLSR